MSEQILDGDAAMAYGALAAGVKLVASYPGSPSSGTVEFLISRAEDHGLYIEWSSNEKVAMELAIGASIAGRRALVCVKSVGMNAMLDPLMVLNLTPVHGGLVILLGDDPGGYGSQNDQDTRSLAPLLEVPWLEPAGPAEGLAMMRAAFDASEQLHLPLILRETRSFAQQLETVDVPEGPYRQPDLGLARERWRFVPAPRNVLEKHRALHERLASAVRGSRACHSTAWVGVDHGESLPPGSRTASCLMSLARASTQVCGSSSWPPSTRCRRNSPRGSSRVAARSWSSRRTSRSWRSGSRRSPTNAGFQPGSLASRPATYDVRGNCSAGRSSGLWPLRAGLAPAREYTAEHEAGERPRRENHCCGVPIPRDPRRAGRGRRRGR